MLCPFYPIWFYLIPVILYTEYILYVFIYLPPFINLSKMRQCGGGPVLPSSPFCAYILWVRSHYSHTTNAVCVQFAFMFMCPELAPLWAPGSDNNPNSCCSQLDDSEVFKTQCVQNWIYFSPKPFALLFFPNSINASRIHSSKSSQNSHSP